MTQRAQWKVIHIARGEESARELLTVLQQEGFLARCRRIASSAPGKDCFEILALPSEASEAQQLLIERNLLR